MLVHTLTHCGKAVCVSHHALSRRDIQVVEHRFRKTSPTTCGVGVVSWISPYPPNGVPGYVLAYIHMYISYWQSTIVYMYLGCFISCLLKFVISCFVDDCVVGALQCRVGEECIVDITGRARCVVVSRCPSDHQLFSCSACHELADCVATSYCRCRPGYVGNGKHCCSEGVCLLCLYYIAILCLYYVYYRHGKSGDYNWSNRAFSLRC